MQMIPTPMHDISHFIGLLLLAAPPEPLPFEPDEEELLLPDWWPDAVIPSIYAQQVCESDPQLCCRCD